MKLTLNTWERVTLTLLVGRVSGNVAVMRKAMKALDALELSDDEKGAVGFAALPSGSLRWEDGEKTFDVEIPDKEAAALVKRVFRENQEWQGIDAKRVVALAEKLGVEEEEKDDLTKER